MRILTQGPSVKLVLVILIVSLGGWLLMHYGVRGRPPEAGVGAPDFSLADAEGRMHRLADYRGRWLVLYFYPRADTPGCTRESCALRDEWLQFRRRQVAVLGISLDRPADQKSFAAKHGLPFPLLSDPSGRVAERYGSVWDLAVIRFAKRHTFLIDPDGRIAKAYLQVTPDQHGKELIRDLETFGVEGGETQTIMNK